MSIGQQQYKHYAGLSINRLYCTLYHRVTGEGGMFGYDWATLKINHPHLSRIMKECVELKHGGEQGGTPLERRRTPLPPTYWNHEYDSDPQEYTNCCLSPSSD